ncbi:MAG: hypothetical protein DME69_02590 [Verrucomicrobia bacterium]|nr:MAG: hypothetical protein DME69_02590 [Verrucomicrobiota bacterium]
MQGRLLVVRLPTRDQLCAHLKYLRVQTPIHYPIAVHQQPAIEKLEADPVGLRNAEIDRLVSRT